MKYDELFHSGTKGQKWYRRLYQNPDGTYTLLGKLRRRKGNEEASTEDLVRKIAKDKTIKDYSNDELSRMAARNQKEADYYRSEKQLIDAIRQLEKTRMPPKKKNAVVKWLMDNVITPSVGDLSRGAGKALTAKILSEIGKDDEDVRNIINRLLDNGGKSNPNGNSARNNQNQNQNRNNKNGNRRK